MDASFAWYRTARIYALLTAVCFILGSLISVLVAFNFLAPERPTFGGPATTLAEAGQITASFLAYNRAIAPQTFAASALIILGMLALIPIGFTLRDLLGRGIHADVMAGEFMAAAVIGATAQLLYVGVSIFAANLNVGALAVQPELLSAFGYARAMVVTASDWLLYAFYMVIGFAAWRAGHLALRTRALPSKWGRVGIALAIGWWIEVVIGVLGDVLLLPYAFLASRLVILIIGVVIAPIWMIWLADELRKRSVPVLSARPV